MYIIKCLGTDVILVGNSYSNLSVEVDSDVLSDGPVFWFWRDVFINDVIFSKFTLLPENASSSDGAATSRLTNFFPIL